MERQLTSIDARMFEAQDNWIEYAQKRGWENPWDMEDEVWSKYRHEEQVGPSSWEIVKEEPSEEDKWKLRYIREYKDKYIKRRDLFLFYQYKEWMSWEKLKYFIPKGLEGKFYPCDAADRQCSLECEWWPCQNERTVEEMEELMP